MMFRTGDIGNALSNLTRSLRKIRYEGELVEGQAREGHPEFFLPLIHYAVLGFSRPLARFLGQRGHDLYGKSDLKFIEGVYKMLRDEFKYSPKLNKAQFFSTAFAEQKMLLTKDIIAHCYAKHNELNKHSSSPSKRQTGSHRVLLPPELGPSYSDFGPVPTDTSWVGSPARPNKSTDGHSHVPISATASLATHDAAVQGTKYGFRPDVGSHHDGVGSASTITAQPVYPRPVDRLYNSNSPPLPLLLFFTSSCLLSLLCFNVKCLTSRADCAP
eukprot:m.83938 g.83938  ORF g.83938 m.83938 type:complete len:272 (+) comp19673_c0_seq2:39-854(+)